MTVSRQDLEALSRDELVKLASDAGAERPSVLTRPDLIDEILRISIADEAQRRSARGLLGRARDLVARVMEKRAQTPSSSNAHRATVQSDGRAPVPTIKLARVYLNQGLHRQARSVLEAILAKSPDNKEARVLLDDWKKSPSAGTSPRVRTSKPSATRNDELNERPIAPETLPVAGPGTSRPPHTIELTPADNGTLQLSWTISPLDFSRRVNDDPDGFLTAEVRFVQPMLGGPARVTSHRRRIDSFKGLTYLLWQGQYATASLQWSTTQTDRTEILAVSGPCLRPTVPQSETHDSPPAR